MAYRRVGRVGYRSRNYRSNFAGTRSRPRRRSVGRTAAVRSRAPQTVRIELVGVPANPISRALPPALAPKAPKKAKY